MLVRTFQSADKYVYVSFFMPDVFSSTCPQTYSQLAHPIQQARALGLLFQSKILDIDNIDVSAFTHFQIFSLVMKIHFIYVQKSEHSYCLHAV